MKPDTFVFLGEELAAYNFGADHPFGPARHRAFSTLFFSQGLEQHVQILPPESCSRQQLLEFHTEEYITRVEAASQTGEGFLDNGDTPAFVGVYDITRAVVGTTLAGINKIMQGQFKRGFTPIGGLHHARRDGAAGFCVFNDCGVAIEVLKHEYGLQRIAYVDIDAHHGDGVYYSFASDPCLIFADLHEDGRYLYPGTGSEKEVGTGLAKGTKLNIPMPVYARDEQFYPAWERVEEFLISMKPEFILFQCGADSIEGDPITHMQYTSQAHRYAAKRLCVLADQLCGGRVMAMGGGGYHLENLAQAWCAVVESLIQHTVKKR